jgi:hypothetical protein
MEASAMGRAIWVSMKFLVGLVIGLLIGAVASAYAAGAADPAAGPREGIMDRVRARMTAAKSAGEAAAMQTEAALTQQFRNRVNNPEALNPPTSLHP